MATKVYYYAYVNEQDIVEQVFSMPAPITSPQYISIPAYDETLIGKRYNRETGEFETVSWYYYAILGDKDIVTDVIRQETALPVVPSNMVQLTSFDETLVGKWYDRVNNVFTEPPVHILADLSTDKINVGTQDIWLTDKLTQLDAADVSAATALGAQENRIAGVEGRVGTAESRLTAAEETGAANASRIGAAETRLTGVEATAANNASRIGSVEGRVGTTETRVTGVEATATSNANRLGGVEGRVGALEGLTQGTISLLQNPVVLTSSNKLENSGFVSFKENYSPYGRASDSQIFVPANVKKALITLDFSTLKTTFCEYAITIMVNNVVVANVPVEGRIGEYAGGNVYRIHYAKMLDVKANDEIRLHMNITKAGQGDGAWFVEGGTMRADFS